VTLKELYKYNFDRK